MGWCGVEWSDSNTEKWSAFVNAVLNSRMTTKLVASRILLIPIDLVSWIVN
jgi:hypothetical protein